jgi:hypothetical protein
MFTKLRVLHAPRAHDGEPDAAASRWRTWTLCRSARPPTCGPGPTCRRACHYAAATRACSSRRRWCFGRCGWGSGSACEGGASWRPWPPASPSLPGCQHSGPRRGLLRPPIRQHRRLATPLLPHLRLRYRFSLFPPQNLYLWFLSFLLFASMYLSTARNHASMRLVRFRH